MIQLKWLTVQFINDYILYLRPLNGIHLQIIILLTNIILQKNILACSVLIK